MQSPVESAVRTYIRAVSERDPTVRARLLESCFAANGRLVSRSRELHGREALADLLTRFVADPQLSRVAVTSPIDVGRTTFRFRSVVERRDGTRLEFFDSGEVDDDGRISLLLTFDGPLGPAEE